MSLELILGFLIIGLLVVLIVVCWKIPERNWELTDRVLRLAEDRERKKRPGTSVEPLGKPAEELTAQGKLDDINAFVKRVTGGV